MKISDLRSDTPIKKKSLLTLEKKTSF